ncbi:MAG: hypothetical protein ACREV0_09390, partial [Burkholderiales bacterium]
MAAVLNYIPYLGPLAALALYWFVALVTFDELIQILAVPLVFLCLTTIEGQFLNPMILGRRLTLKSGHRVSIAAGLGMDLGRARSVAGGAYSGHSQ